MRYEIKIIFIVTILFISINSSIQAVETNISTLSNDVKEIKSSKMDNLGFFYMFTSSKFDNHYSAGYEDDKKYFHIPYNSWNDSFYIVLNFDWEFVKKFKLRYGWGIELNFSGSGNSEGEADKIPSDSDLAKEGADNYANFVSHKFTGYFNLVDYPLKLSFLELYAGVGVGGGIGWFTYNEIADKNISTFEQNYRETFIKLLPAIKIFGGIILYISDSIEPIYLEIAYKFSKEPIFYHSAFKRYVKFQVSGFMLGVGFRY